MELRILGSGSCAPSSERNSSGYLLSAGGKRFLLDAGPGTFAQLNRFSIDLTTIEEVFITHLHVDHVNDLPAILFSLRHCVPKKSQKMPVIHGPEGFENDINTLLSAYGSQIISEDFKLNVVEHKADEEGHIEDFNTGLMVVKSLPMEHSPVSVGYRFDLYPEKPALLEIKKSSNAKNIQSNEDITEDDSDNSGFVPDNFKEDVAPLKSLTYSGDTAPCKNIINLANGSNCLLIEASSADTNKLQGHSTIAESASVAQKAKVETLVLTHISPENDRMNIEKKASEIFNGIVIVAKDGMRITI
ncbi:MAG: MBL fold metallo-hydrolase [Nitrospinota bacterium]|nr:MBL fold metallo-hydrolase [Nitrospinota bacterium]